MEVPVAGQPISVKVMLEQVVAQDGIPVDASKICACTIVARTEKAQRKERRILPARSTAKRSASGVLEGIKDKQEQGVWPCQRLFQPADGVHSRGGKKKWPPVPVRIKKRGEEPVTNMCACQPHKIWTMCHAEVPKYSPLNFTLHARLDRFQHAT